MGANDHEGGVTVAEECDGMMEEVKGLLKARDADALCLEAARKFRDFSLISTTRPTRDNPFCS